MSNSSRLRGDNVECGTYVNGPEASAVTRGHLLVHLVDCVAAGHLAVLLVHVVGAGTRVVADPDAERLDLGGLLLRDLELLSVRALSAPGFTLPVQARVRAFTEPDVPCSG